MKKKMPLICEICGKEIIAPNYIYEKSEGLYESFYECANCNLDFLIDRYMEFKDETLGLRFHQNLLIQINALNFTILSFK